MTEESGNAYELKRQQNIERNNAQLRASGLSEIVANFHDRYFKRPERRRQRAPATLKQSQIVRRSARTVTNTRSLAEDSLFPRFVIDDIALTDRRALREKMPVKQRLSVEWGEHHGFEDDASKENAEGWFRKIYRNTELKGKEKKAMDLAYGLSQEDVTFQSVKAKNLTTEELMAAAFGEAKRTSGLKSAMLRVLKEVEEGGTEPLFE